MSRFSKGFRATEREGREQRKLDAQSEAKLRPLLNRCRFDLWRHGFEATIDDGVLRINRKGKADWSPSAFNVGWNDGTFWVQDVACSTIGKALEEIGDAVRFRKDNSRDDDWEVKPLIGGFWPLLALVALLFWVFWATGFISR